MPSTVQRERKGFYQSDEVSAAPATPEGGALEVLAGCSIIAAVNSAEKFVSALASPTRAIYLLTGTPLTLPDMVARARDHGKICLVNTDFLDGLSKF